MKSSYLYFKHRASHCSICFKTDASTRGLSQCTKSSTNIFNLIWKNIMSFNLRNPTAVTTRNHSTLTLRIPSSRTNAYHKSYIPNTVKDWNSLPYLTFTSVTSPSKFRRHPHRCVQMWLGVPPSWPEMTSSSVVPRKELFNYSFKIKINE